MTQQEKTTSASDCLTAQQAFEKFFTPPRKLPTEQEQKFQEQADIFTIPAQPAELTAYSWGKGKTILLVHGWGGRATQLGSFVEPLVELGYRVLAFDAPAHGKTAGTQTNVLQFAQAIKTVVEKEGSIDSIIAHSLGSASTSIVLNEGLQVRKIIFLGAVCYISTTVKMFCKSAKLSPELEQELRSLMEIKFGRDVWQELSVDKRVNSLKIPALLFHDRNDREIPLEESIAINKSWSDSQLITTSRLGHRRILRNEEVIQQTIKFIASK
ncbi:putative hydrolase or acyltransferase of alpha/beta superfamily [Rivularia sp. PCC 7116]|uniref:alpha/beta hydrolase n=1 Tax=Rivularia sp. PCC 7116 TaxID=373994 RepID=UPI00029F34DE|nr:alpha/beta hydrolase [Rivularia sp. PCC 7116]AFY54771.1 putative hydrolase or acyltransferase of alpha/beta superfamily [Rivularia sp. PCC 7116]